MNRRRYSIDPFIALTGWNMSAITDVAPCGGDEYHIRLTVGVTERIADRIACAAGYHPHEVWPEMLDHAIADLPDKICPECKQFFIPSRPSVQRFCSKACYGRDAWRNRDLEGAA